MMEYDSDQGRSTDMPREACHPHVEFAVDDVAGRERIFKTAAEASGFAVSISLSGRENVYIDVLVYSREGAEWYRGSSDGGDEYDEDPDASVFERIEIRADCQGRVS